MDIQTKTDIIHQKIYDFLLYIYPLLTKYPKYEKFSLQTATRNAILEMLQEVIKWDKTATKSHLYTVDTALQESKELLRLAHDLKYSAMNARHYGESCRKHELGVEAYIRYMDDFVILSPDKEQLRNWLARIEQFLREELKLEFNPKTTMLAAKNGIDFVGYKHRATHRKVRKDSIKRIKRTIKKCESGKITKEQLQKSIQSWTGHAGHADSYNLRKKIETLAEAAIEKAA